MIDHYEAFAQTCRKIYAIKDQIKTLWAAGEAAAQLAKNNTVGTTAEKIAAIRLAWVPFKEAIAEAEQKMAQLEQERTYHNDRF